MKKYGIVCGSRSGSTYLSSLLISTNRCGYPQEYFNESLKFTERSCRHELLRKYKTANEVFGAKIVGLGQLRDFGLSGITLTHWIWLHREDSILQAISRYIAHTTNGWHHPRPLPEYSYEGIAWCLEEVYKENEQYKTLFSHFDGLGIDYLKLSYETDVCENPEQAITSILHYLNINIEDLPKIKTVRKLTDDTNLQWKTQFETDRSKNA